MKEKHEIIKYDKDLQVELYHFINTRQTYLCHSHAYYVIALVEAGEARLLCSHEEYIVRPGGFILLNPGDNHICGPLHEERGWTYRALHVSAQAVRMYCEVEEGKSSPVFEVHSATNEMLQAHFYSLHAIWLNGDGGQSTKKKEEFMVLLKNIVEEFAEFETVSAQLSNTVCLLSASIQENYSKNTTVELLCKALHICEREAQRLFKRELGISPRRYLLTQRINEAQRLLKTGMLISQVALQVGFFDHAHFTKAFKSSLGVTPEMYKKSVFDTPRSKNKTINYKSKQNF